MKKLNVLNYIHATLGETQHKNKKGKMPGSNKEKFVAGYRTLKVVKRSLRTSENCNAQGIAISAFLGEAD